MPGSNDISVHELHEGRTPDLVIDRQDVVGGLALPALAGGHQELRGVV